MSNIGSGAGLGRQFLKNIRDKAAEKSPGQDMAFVTVDSVSGDLVTVALSYGGGSTRKVARVKGPTVAVGDRGLLVSTTGGGMVFIPTGGSTSATADHEHPGTQTASLRIGTGAVATLRGHALGYNASAADGAVGIGHSTAASGYLSVAIGYGAIAAGEGAIGLGYHLATGDGVFGMNSIGIGWAVGATADYSLAIGSGSRISAAYGIALGYLSDAGYSGSAYGEVAIGRGAKAKFARGIAIGHDAQVTRHYEATMKADALVIRPSSTRTYSKLGLADVVTGTITYIQISNGAIQVTTTW